MASQEAKEKMQISPALPCKKDEGFSFVEILIALVIITMGFSVTARSIVTLTEAQAIVESQCQSAKKFRETTAVYLSHSAAEFNKLMEERTTEAELLPRLDAKKEDLYQAWQIIKFPSAERSGYHVELAIAQSE